MLICISRRQQKHQAKNNSDFITHFTKKNFQPTLFTANVECNSTVIKRPKTEKPIRFLSFKFSLNGDHLVFWFTFNLAVDFRPKMALTLEMLTDQRHILPRNSAVYTIFLFVGFRNSKSALFHLLSEARCSLFTDKEAKQRDIT